jgi:hypothetical protein
VIRFFILGADATCQETVSSTRSPRVYTPMSVSSPFNTVLSSQNDNDNDSQNLILLLYGSTIQTLSEKKKDSWHRSNRQAKAAEPDS